MMRRGTYMRCRKCSQRFRFEPALESHNNGCCSYPCLKVVGPSSEITVFTRKGAMVRRGKKMRVISGNAFYGTREWMAVRYVVLKEQGRKCACCGATQGEMHVDHIKPRSKYPLLALERTNLQVLCRPCNLGKSNGDETDWRSLPEKEVDSTLATPDNQLNTKSSKEGETQC